MSEKEKNDSAHNSISDKVDKVTEGDEIERSALRPEKKSDSKEKLTAVQVVKKGERNKVAQSRKHSVKNSLHQPLRVVNDNEKTDIGAFHIHSWIIGDVPPAQWCVADFGSTLGDEKRVGFW